MQSKSNRFSVAAFVVLFVLCFAAARLTSGYFSARKAVAQAPVVKSTKTVAQIMATINHTRSRIIINPKTHKKRQQLALPTTIIVTGAGTTADNGTYTLSTLTDANGNLYYQKGSLYLEYYPGIIAWVLVPSLTGASYPTTIEHYLGPRYDTSTTISLTGWTVYGAGPASAPAPTLSGGSPGRIGYKYYSPAAYGADPTPVNLASFTTDTPGYLADLTAGDTTTGYSSNNFSTGGLNYSTLYGLVDMGTLITPTIARATLSISGATLGAYLSLYSSIDGANWINQSTSTAPVSTGTTTWFPPDTTPCRYWYWRLATQWSGSPGTLSITDMRFYIVYAAPGGGGRTVEYIPVSPPPSGTTLAARGVIDTLFSDSRSRSAQRLQSRGVIDNFFGDAFVPTGVTLASRGYTDTLLTDAFAGVSAGMSPRNVSDALFTTTEARLNNPAHSGGSTPPIVVLDGFLGSSEGRGAMTLAARGVVDHLFSDAHGFGVRSLATRGYSNALFSGSEKSGSVTHAPNPANPDNRDPFVFVNQIIAIFNSLKGRPVLDSTFIRCFDDWAAAYRATDAGFTANRLAASLVDVVGGDGVTSTVYGSGSESYIAKVGPALGTAAVTAQPDPQNQRIYAPLFSAVTSWLNSADGGNYSSIDAWANARRAINPALARFHPNTAKQYMLYNQSQGNLLFTPANVFAPQTNYGSATVGAAGVITFTDAGSVPIVNVTTTPIAQGYTPPLGLVANITTTINGTLIITITFDGQSSAGAAVTGRTGTITLSSLAAGAQSAQMTPTIAGDRVADITAVVKSGSPTATAGAFTLDSVLERVIS